MIYFDNAASSWPKPSEVSSAIQDFIQLSSANPGRSGHRMARQAATEVFRARQQLARFIGTDDVERVIFTANATEALNLAMKGTVHGGHHVITTILEHNSVIRPLRMLEKNASVAVEFVPCNSSGVVEPGEIKKRIRPNTKLIVMTHASNVTGAIQPVAEVGQIARKAGVLFLVDSAQTLGIHSLDVKSMHADLLAVTGHKGAFGPQGIGALYVRQGVDISPLKAGGTGSFSEMEQQPVQYPDFLESGTLNGVGIVGLGAGLQFLQDQSLEVIMRHEHQLKERLVAGLRENPMVTVYGHQEGIAAVPVVSFNIKGCDPSEVSFVLDRVYDIAVRPGLHCAPLVHRWLGTFPQGTIRASLSYFNTMEEVDRFIEVTRQISAEL